jgi:hypothetical protein
MKNKHIEHPEDSILNGDLSVLNWFTADSHISVKIDGSPAIVWGTNPANNKFFVGTKSVFNKKLIKINHNHADVDRNHKGKVADILHLCLDNLPFTDNIYQGDYLGCGGTDSFNPNTIRYDFPDKVFQEIVIAPHTVYFAKKDLRDAVAVPMDFTLIDTLNCKFIQPEVTLKEDRVSMIDRCNFARQIATLCEFPNDKQVKTIKRQLNTCIREEIELDDLTIEALASDNEIDVNVLRLWQLVRSMKWDLFSFIERDDEIECYINDYGTFKLVDRDVFSKNNFLKVRD